MGVLRGFLGREERVAGVGLLSFFDHHASHKGHDGSENAEEKEDGGEDSHGDTTGKSAAVLGKVITAEGTGQNEGVQQEGKKEGGDEELDLLQHKPTFPAKTSAS